MRKLPISATSIPLLFLISIFVDNEWETESEEIILGFLADYVGGHYGLPPTDLDSFMDLISKTKLNDLETVDLNEFLRSQILNLCESRMALESFVKEVESLITSDNKNISPNSRLGIYILSFVRRYNELLFEESIQFFEELKSYCTKEIDAEISLDPELCEIYIDRQVQILESAVRVPPPEQISKALQAIAKSLPSLHKRHYLGYLNSLRCGDLETSLSELRYYFDLTMKNTTQPIQYTALNMAALYMSLNRQTEALASIEKGILYARDENDQECLAYLLSWLYQIIYESNSTEFRTPYQPSAQQMLDSLSTRSKSQKQFKLLAVCELKKARLQLESFGDQELVLEHLESAMKIISKFSIDELQADADLLRAAAHRILGNTLIATNIMNNLLLGNPQITDAQKAMIISQQAYHHARLGDHDRSLEILQSLKKEYPAGSYHTVFPYLLHTAALVLFEKSFYLGNYLNSKHILDCWEAHIDREDPMFMHFLKLRAQVLHASGLSYEAIECLSNNKLNFDKRTTCILERLGAQLMKVDILLSANDCYTTINSMNLLFSIMDEAEQRALKSIINLSMVRFAEILIQLEYPKEACIVLNQVLPYILTYTHVSEQGRAFCALVKATINSGLNNNNSDLVIAYLNDALNCFEKLQFYEGQFQVFELFNIVFGQLKMTAEAAESQEKLNALQRRLKNHTESPESPYSWSSFFANEQ